MQQQTHLLSWPEPLKQDRATGLVNAAMRRAIREQDSLLGLTSVLDNLPTALKASWAAAYGPEQTAAIAIRR